MLKNNYKNFNKFILRTPLYPIGFLKELLANENVEDSQLKKVCKNKEVLEAIFLASPNLHDKILKWLDGKLKDKKEIDKLPQAIYKYLARMSTRCTPFGLFAGNSVGHITKKTNLTIPPVSGFRRVTRLDMNYLCSLAQDLLKETKIKEKTRFYPNTSLYIFGDMLRYTEYYYENTRRIHQIAAVENSEYLQKVLEKARQGAKLHQLAESIANNDIGLDEAIEFIHELINNQILLPEFEPSVTGNGFLENILDFLKNNKPEESQYEILFNVYQQLKEIDQQPPGINTSKYIEIAENLKKVNTSYELKYLFQADMIKPADNLSLNSSLIEQVKDGIEVLNTLTVEPAENSLTRFRNAFSKKYEDKEIPLLQALDTESGIGFLRSHSLSNGDYAPLIDDIVLPRSDSQSYTIEWNKVQSYLLKKYLEAIKENRYQVELTEREIKELASHQKLKGKCIYQACFDSAQHDQDSQTERSRSLNDQTNSYKATGANEQNSLLPVTISSMVQLVKLNGNEKIIMESAGGSGAANLLGRFCHTDNEINEHVKEIVNKEKAFYHDKIVAEIVHLPESRTGNILHRPVLRDFEIPYLARSSVKKESQILPEDIMVSVHGNRIVLRSKKLNKEIIPRLTTAHNF